MNTIQKQEPKFIEFAPFGAVDKIKLSVEIVKRFVAVPTKTGKTCDDAQATRFMMLCQTQRLNPFAGDCFLCGYDGKNGPVFSLITAHQAFLKRAETCADFEGMESGIIIVDSDNKISEREGDFHLQDENVVGGWAKVYRKGRKPTYRRLATAAMRPNYETPFWSATKEAGQIVKCAEADALRSTFPTLLGGLYTEGESAQIIDVSTTISTDTSKLVAQVSSSDVPETESQKSTEQTNTQPSPNDELAALVVNEGFTFDHYRQWLKEGGHVQDADSLAGFEDVPTEVARRHARAKAGLLKGLSAIKGAQPV